MLYALRERYATRCKTINTREISNLNKYLKGKTRGTVLVHVTEYDVLLSRRCVNNMR